MTVRRMLATDHAQVAAWKRELWAADDGMDEDEAVFVWEDDGGKLGGFVSVSLRPWAEGCHDTPVPYIEGWYVAAPLRRRGVGKALIDAVEAWASAAGFSELGSDVRVDNDASLEAHHRLGFVPTERLQYFRKPLTPG